MVDGAWKAACSLYNGESEGKLPLFKRVQVVVPPIRQRTPKGTDIF